MTGRLADEWTASLNDACLHIVFCPTVDGGCVVSAAAHEHDLECLDLVRSNQPAQNLVLHDGRHLLDLIDLRFAPPDQSAVSQTLLFHHVFLPGSIQLVQENSSWGQAGAPPARSNMLPVSSFPFRLPRPSLHITGGDSPSAACDGTSAEKWPGAILYKSHRKEETDSFYRSHLPGLGRR
jgi:hypothetical protein